jgi:hypothetical protein
MAGFVLNYPNLKSWAERVFGTGFPYSDEASQIAIICRLIDTDVPLLFIPRPERGMLTLAVTMPFKVPSERYAAVGEALTLLNARSYMGAWILNVDQGVTYSDQSMRFVAGVVASSAEAMARPLFAVALQGARPSTVAGPASVG